jgi:hypothetical protein
MNYLFKWCEKTGAMFFHGDHDIIHSLMVANYAYKIVPDRETTELAWVSAICHNTDRIFCDQEDFNIEKRVLEYLRFTDLNNDEALLVVDAVMNHGGPNNLGDSQVKITLQDADRISDIGLLLMRYVRASIDRIFSHTIRDL